MDYKYDFVWNENTWIQFESMLLPYGVSKMLQRGIVFSLYCPNGKFLSFCTFSSNSIGNWEKICAYDMVTKERVGNITFQNTKHYFFSFSKHYLIRFKWLLKYRVQISLKMNSLLSFVLFWASFTVIRPWENESTAV